MSSVQQQNSKMLARLKEDFPELAPYFFIEGEPFDRLMLMTTNVDGVNFQKEIEKMRQESYIEDVKSNGAYDYLILLK